MRAYGCAWDDHDIEPALPERCPVGGERGGAIRHVEPNDAATYGSPVCRRVGAREVRNVLFLVAHSQHGARTVTAGGIGIALSRAPTHIPEAQ